MQNALIEATDEYMNKMLDSKNNNKRTSKGTISLIIDAAKERNGIPANVKVSFETVRSRAAIKIKKSGEVQNGQHHISKHGHQSPMNEIEPYLVGLIQQLAKMRVPISVSEGLMLANSLIAGTETMAKVNNWRETNCIPFQINKKPELGKSYWKGFMKRNAQLVTAKKGVKFESKRADWCTYQSFLSMYKDVYKEMVAGGVARRNPSKQWYSKEGLVVEEQEAFGLASEYELIRPDRLLFVDEVGSNTSQTKDGNVGGEKFLCIAGGRPQIRASTKDAHFTVLGFTAANGQPIMCAIIFAAKALEDEWVLGLDPFAAWEGEDENIHGNSGKGKRYPQGPVCDVEGKQLPTYCCVSENGSITAELLVGMLKHMDDSGIFPRNNGPPPFLILDGHGSRFDILFLEYINNPVHNWTVCIGVPYGTSYWQVGDSSEQNGCFKMNITKAKRKLLTLKADHRQELTINKVDIVGLVNTAWDNSFANIATNKKAIYERGWYPLNYNVLLHPEIQLTQPQQNINAPTETATLPPDELNLQTGFAGTIVGRINDFCKREDVRNGIDREAQARKRKETADSHIEGHKKRITAGLLASAQTFALGPNILAATLERKRISDIVISTKETKRQQEFNTLRGKVLTLKEQNKTKEQMSVPELKLMVRWYKRSGDLPVPQTRQALITRFDDTNHRGDQQPPFPLHAPPIAVVVVTAPPPVAIPSPSTTATADPPFRDEV